MGIYKLIDKAVDYGYTSWYEGYCHDRECGCVTGCVTEYIKAAIRAELSPYKILVSEMENDMHLNNHEQWVRDIEDYSAGEQQNFRRPEPAPAANVPTGLSVTNAVTGIVTVVGKNKHIETRALIAAAKAASKKA